MYVDGALVNTLSGYHLANDFTGQLVLGTSPVANESWRGELLGLAIYRRDLTSMEVRQHFETWTKQGKPQGDDGAVAIYLFNEHSGDVAHNAIGGGIDLQIPGKYTILHQRFMEPFWQEFTEDQSYWKDALINVIGLVPLGFVFYAYWSRVRSLRRALLITTLFGLAVSLTIELLQSTLPTRNSGTSDLFTNTFGTFLGAKLCDTKLGKVLLEWFYPPRQDPD